MSSSRRLVPTIHARGEATRLDAVLELVAFSARSKPLSVALDELPRRIAKVLSADICSIYLLERETLVMRGNVGFPTGALGEVRLGVGHGVTGLSVEYMRPISLNAAPAHESYQHFPQLGGEERFPIFLAVPIAGPSGPLGALVLQRRGLPAFSAGEIELAAALTAPIAAMADRARLVDALQRGEDLPAGRGARRITLSGRTAVAGQALGVVRPLPRPDARFLGSTSESPKALARTLEAAIDEALRVLTSVQSTHAGSAEERSTVAIVQTILEDARLRERAIELGTKSQSARQALLSLGAEVLRTATQLKSEFGIERARLISDVCEALSVMVEPNWKPDIPAGGVLVGNHFTAFDLLVSMRTRPAAVVLAEHTNDPLSRHLLTLAAVPSVLDVESLFHWCRVGEIALVDADHGIVRLNPSRAEIAAVRREKKNAAR